MQFCIQNTRSNGNNGNTIAQWPLRTPHFLHFLPLSTLGRNPLNPPPIPPTYNMPPPPSHRRCGQRHTNLKYRTLKCKVSIHTESNCIFVQLYSSDTIYNFKTMRTFTLDRHGGYTPHLSFCVDKDPMTGRFKSLFHFTFSRTIDVYVKGSAEMWEIDPSRFGPSELADLYEEFDESMRRIQDWNVIIKLDDGFANSTTISICNECIHGDEIRVLVNKRPFSMRRASARPRASSSSRSTQFVKKNFSSAELDSIREDANFLIQQMGPGRQEKENVVVEKTGTICSYRMTRHRFKHNPLDF